MSGAPAEAMPLEASSEKLVFDSVLQAVGHTPLIRLTKIVPADGPAIYIKLEGSSVGGSIKDRIGLHMLDVAEKEGKVGPGSVIVEPTSGNTGMGLCLVAAQRGYRCIFTMPDKMSSEKILALEAFGAEVIVCPTAVAPDDPRSYYAIAQKLSEEIPNAFMPSQYHNPANPETHYLTTGPELWNQTDGKITHFVASIGTGGTISGTGKFLKEKDPKIQVVGVDPVGSILREYFYNRTMGEAGTYKVEGIGEDFLPPIYNWDIIDDITQINDEESFHMTRKLARDEGLFVGGSCGAALVGAMKYVKEKALGPDANVVVIFPDSGSRYLNKVHSDAWMVENGFLTESDLPERLSKGYEPDLKV